MAQPTRTRRIAVPSEIRAGSRPAGQAGERTERRRDDLGAFAGQVDGAPGPQHKSGVGVFIAQLQPLLAPVMQRPQEAGQVAASVGELMDDAVRLGSYLD
jgi:hypothetical protein